MLESPPQRLLSTAVLVLSMWHPMASGKLLYLDDCLLRHLLPVVSWLSFEY